jgi:hypothetical protein
VVVLKRKIAHIGLNIRSANLILLTPQFFPKLKGHEREFLVVMLDRYDEAAKLQARYGEDFGAALSGVNRFCLRSDVSERGVVKPAPSTVFGAGSELIEGTVRSSASPTPPPDAGAMLAPD